MDVAAPVMMCTAGGLIEGFMAEIIPALNRETLSRMTSGEKRFAQRLKDLLEDDYLCWYDIPVGKKRRYPDFIVLHPGRGLLFLEVKDWKPATLKGLTPEIARLQTPTGLVNTANPVTQVRQCAMSLVNQLSADPQLRQPMTGKYAGKLVTPYAWGVVFTNITRRQMENAAPEAERQRLLPDHLMIYKDEMTENTDAEAFQEQLWGMFQHQFPEKLTLPQIDRLRWHLFPEIRINHLQDDLFGEVDAEIGVTASEAQNLPDIIRIMDIQQEQLARSIGEGHRIIHGVAGSGKTLILGFRCQLLAQTSSKPILVLCFNVTLAAKLRSFIALKGIQHQVQVCHFHDWCARQLKTYNVDLLKGDAPVWVRQVATVIDAVDKGLIPRHQYGALLIDEGHDFEADWLKLIVQMIDPDTSSLLLLYDDAQSIYKQRSGLGFSLSSVGIRAQGRTTILKLNYRNSREILEFAYQFARHYLAPQQSDEDHIPSIEPEAAGSHGPAPVARHFHDWNAEIEYTVECLRSWKKQGLDWKEMAVVYVAGYQGAQLSKRLQRENLPHTWLGIKAYKQAYDANIDQITLLTVHSSKGLEFQAVAMVGIGQLNNTDEEEKNARLLYVGMTRAQQHLSISSSADTVLSRKVMALAS